MAVLNGPFNNFNKSFREKYEKGKEEGKSGLQIILTGVFVFIVILVVLIPLWAGLSWCFAWLWNVAVVPFGGPTLTWFQFGCGWLILMFLQNLIKNCFKK